MTVAETAVPEQDTRDQTELVAPQAYELHDLPSHLEAGCGEHGIGCSGGHEQHIDSGYIHDAHEPVVTCPHGHKECADPHDEHLHSEQIDHGHDHHEEHIHGREEAKSPEVGCSAHGPSCNGNHKEHIDHGHNHKAHETVVKCSHDHKNCADSHVHESQIDHGHHDKKHTLERAVAKGPEVGCSVHGKGCDGHHHEHIDHGHRDVEASHHAVDKESVTHVENAQSNNGHNSLEIARLKEMAHAEMLIMALEEKYKKEPKGLDAQLQEPTIIEQTGSLRKTKKIPKATDKIYETATESKMQPRVTDTPHLDLPVVINTSDSANQSTEIEEPEIERSINTVVEQPQTNEIQTVLYDKEVKVQTELAVTNAVASVSQDIFDEGANFQPQANGDIDTENDGFSIESSGGESADFQEDDTFIVEAPQAIESSNEEEAAPPTLIEEKDEFMSIVRDLLGTEEASDSIANDNEKDEIHPSNLIRKFTDEIITETIEVGITTEQVELKEKYDVSENDFLNGVDSLKVDDEMRVQQLKDLLERFEITNFAIEIDEDAIEKNIEEAQAILQSFGIRITVNRKTTKGGLYQAGVLAHLFASLKKIEKKYHDEQTAFSSNSRSQANSQIQFLIRLGKSILHLVKGDRQAQLNKKAYAF